MKPEKTLSRCCCRACGTLYDDATVYDVHPRDNRYLALVAIAGCPSCEGTLLRWAGSQIETRQ